MPTRTFEQFSFGGRGEFCFWRKKIHLGLKEKLRIQAFFMEPIGSARDSFRATTGLCWCIGLRIGILLQPTSKNSFLQPNRSSVNVDIVIIHFTEKKNCLKQPRWQISNVASLSCKTTETFSISGRHTPIFSSPKQLELLWAPSSLIPNVQRGF